MRVRQTIAALAVATMIGTSKGFHVMHATRMATQRTKTTNTWAPLWSSPTNVTTTITTTSPLSMDIEQDAWNKKQELDDLMLLQEEPTGSVWQARLLLLVAAALYGTNFSLVKELGDAMPIGIGATLRFGIAALVMLPWLVAKSPKGQEDTRIPSIMGGFEAGTWNSIAYLAQAIGLKTTEASKSAFICSLSVVIVPMLDLAVGKKLSRDQILGALMAVAGVALLEFGGGDGGGLSQGDIASLIQPFGFGMAFWSMERTMHAFPHEASRATAAQLVPVLVVSAIYTALTETLEEWSWLSDPTVLFALFWTGVVTTAVTIYMESLALKTLSAAETTLIFSTEPVWGALFASVLMGEHLGTGAVAGAGLIVWGCVYSSLGFQGSFLPLLQMAGLHNNNNNNNNNT